MTYISKKLTWHLCAGTFQMLPTVTRLDLGASFIYISSINDILQVVKKMEIGLDVMIGYDCCSFDISMVTVFFFERRPIVATWDVHQCHTVGKDCKLMHMEIVADLHIYCRERSFYIQVILVVSFVRQTCYHGAAKARAVVNK